MFRIGKRIQMGGLAKSVALISMALLSLSCETISGLKDSEQYIFLDTNDTLQIVLRHNADPRLMLSSPTLAENAVSQRYRDFEAVCEELLPTIDLPMDYRVVGERESPDENMPILHVYAMRWGSSSLGEIEAVIRVRLHWYSEVNTIGSFSESDMPGSFDDSDKLEKLYRRTMFTSLTEMFPLLLEHFKLPGE